MEVAAGSFVPLPPFGRVGKKGGLIGTSIMRERGLGGSNEISDQGTNEWGGGERELGDSSRAREC